MILCYSCTTSSNLIAATSRWHHWSIVTVVRWHLSDWAARKFLIIFFRISRNNWSLVNFLSIIGRLVNNRSFRMFGVECEFGEVRQMFNGSIRLRRTTPPYRTIASDLVVFLIRYNSDLKWRKIYEIVNKFQKKHSSFFLI